MIFNLELVEQIWTRGWVFGNGLHESHARVRKTWPFVTTAASGKAFLLQAMGIFLPWTQSFKQTVGEGTVLWLGVSHAHSGQAGASVAWRKTSLPKASPLSVYGHSTRIHS